MRNRRISERRRYLAMGMVADLLMVPNSPFRSIKDVATALGYKRTGRLESLVANPSDGWMRPDRYVTLVRFYRAMRCPIHAHRRRLPRRR
jgi:hypothetical protein